uniref:Putative plant transposon protein domain-containing protein n=1 Tax=Solanum tuberosum TaxID=4113 RepID=M1DKU2_SOLTU
MARLITEERRVLTGSLHTVSDIHRLFSLHKCDWMARDPGTYSEEIVREVYASYAATLRGSISKRSKPLAQDPLTSTMVRGCPVDISPATISHFLYGPTTGHSWSLNIAKFDYRWDIVWSGTFQRNAEQQEAVLLWLASSSVPSPEGKNQVGERKEKSADHRVVPRCSVGSPKITDLEDVEGQGREAIEVTKGRIAEWFGDPDILRRARLTSLSNSSQHIFGDYKYIFEHLI